MKVGSNPTFAQIYNEFKPGLLSSDKHIRSEGTKLYTHSSLIKSRSGADAAQERAGKHSEGAAQIKAAIARDYGPEFADKVFQKVGQQTGRDLNAGVLRSDLAALAREIATPKDKASPEFTREISNSINKNMKQDIGKPEKFVNNMFTDFSRDAGRATFILDGAPLEKEERVVEAAFAQKLSPEQLRAATAVLHQGTPGATVIIGLAESDHGFHKGLMGAALVMGEPELGIPPTQTTYSLRTQGPDGRRYPDGHLGVSIECRMPVQNQGGSTDTIVFDASKSYINTRMEGTITFPPGEDPVFKLTQPLLYSKNLVPKE